MTARLQGENAKLLKLKMQCNNNEKLFMETTSTLFNVHYHCRGLINDFLNHRKLIEPVLYQLVDQYVADYQNILLYGSNIDTISHYGFYSAVIATNDKVSLHEDRVICNNKYLKAIAATEHYDVLLSPFMCTILWIYDFGVQAMLMLVEIVENKKVLNGAFAQLLLKTFIHFYLLLNGAKDPKPYTSCHSSVLIPFVKAALGYMMIFTAEIIIKNIPFIKQYKNKQMFFSDVSSSKRKLLLKDVNSWTVDSIKITGRNYIFAAYDLQQNKNLNNDDFVSEDLYHQHFILGKVYSVIFSNYFCGNDFYAISIVSSNELYYRALSMIACSDNCYKNKEYLLGLKLLICVYKLCKGRMLYNFTNNEYFRKRKNFKKQCKKMVCHNCRVGPLNANMNTIKCCSGCMQATYCSRHCQKIDWRNRHHRDCDHGWEKMYRSLKRYIFERL
eukprot:556178_1